MSYSVEKLDYGFILRGTITVPEYVALLRIWDERGYTLVDAGLGEKLRKTDPSVNTVVVSKGGSMVWRRELGLEP